MTSEEIDSYRHYLETLTDAQLDNEARIVVTGAIKREENASIMIAVLQREYTTRGNHGGFVAQYNLAVDSAK